MAAMKRTVSALMVAAPASHQGKTLLTAALIRLWRRRGLAVAAFKAGPDFLDPMILARAAGRPVDNLDSWMVGEAACRRRFARAAAWADVVVVEAVMGLSDGSPSSADLARLLGLPVALVADASGMAQGFAAVPLGVRALEPDLHFLGVLANRVAGARHEALIRARLPADLPFLGAVPRDAGLVLPERHLGLVQAAELPDLEAALDRAAGHLAKTALVEPPPPVPLPAAEPEADEPRLRGRRVAVARDAAFAFVYPANVDWLRRQGAQVRFFSPLAGDPLPDCDALWLPGGYPELHLETLAARTDLMDQIRAHHRAGRPILAECGGMLFLLRSLRDRDGREYRLAGLLPGEGAMTNRPQGLGMQAVEWAGETLRGHTFHYARAEVEWSPTARARRHPDGAPGEAVFCRSGLWASFMHLYFPSAPRALAGLLGAQRKR